MRNPGQPMVGIYTQVKVGSAREDFAAASGAGQVVVLDTRLDESLRREGLGLRLAVLDTGQRLDAVSVGLVQVVDFECLQQIFPGISPKGYMSASICNY